MKLILHITAFLSGSISLWLLVCAPESPWVVVFGCALGFSLGLLLIGSER